MLTGRETRGMRRVVGIRVPDVLQTGRVQGHGEISKMKQSVNASAKRPSAPEEGHDMMGGLERRSPEAVRGPSFRTMAPGKEKRNLRELLKKNRVAPTFA